MTFYYRFKDTEVLDENSLEGVAVLVKRKKQQIDALAAQYESLQSNLSKVMEQQTEASKQYKELKEKLVELANDIKDE